MHSTEIKKIRDIVIDYTKMFEGFLSPLSDELS